MANPHKTATIEDWQRLGALTKKINRDIQEACSLASKMMAWKDWKYLGQSANKISLFKSHAEDIMFIKGPRDIHIFYGNDYGSDPRDTTVIAFSD